MIKEFKQKIIDNSKNVLGWSTNRKFIVFSVDDYGNVRLDSKKARQNLDKAGLKVNSRFDAYDTLETREDLESLYEVLSSVKDKNKSHAIFTPFALPCNINFEALIENSFEQYTYELLPKTYEKLSAADPKAYNNAWDLWNEGINNGLMKPQSHGREHLNVKVLNEKLKQKDHEVLTAIKNRSYTSISNLGYKTINSLAAFDFDKSEELENLKKIIDDGLTQFQKVYGYASTHFNSPGGAASSKMNTCLQERGVKLTDSPSLRVEHLGSGKYDKSLVWGGKKANNGLHYVIRNAVFEPTNDNRDWVSFTLKQIETAFFWNKPAIISSHRVNFCGHIDTKNRETSLLALKDLLQKIVKKWPDVEFVSSVELGAEIAKK
jgi:hypothetical protein